MSTTEVWNEFSDRLWAFIRKRVSNDSIANDLLQEAFIKIHLHVDGLRDDTRVLPWLYQVTRNVVTDYYRATAAQPVSRAEIADEAAEQTETHEDGLIQCLEVFVKRLPPGYRQAIEWSELQGLRQQEVADRLGISLSGAKSRIQRGRKLLRNQFQACCRFELDKQGLLKGSHNREDCTICNSPEHSNAPPKDGVADAAC